MNSSPMARLTVLGQKALVLVEPEHKQIGRERHYEPEALRRRLALAALADNEANSQLKQMEPP